MVCGEPENTQQGQMPSLAPGKEEPLAGVQAEDRGAWGSSSAGKALGVLADSQVPREVVPSPCLEVFKAGLGKTLSNLVRPRG